MPQRALTRLPLALLVLALTLPASRAEALSANLTLTQYLHRIWQVQQGLPQATVNAICQTSDGYLWLGTQGGLVRFDGVRFTVVKTVDDPSLDNVWVRDLEEDSQHALWIGTRDKGIFRRTADGRFTRFSQVQGLPANDVYQILIDKNDLWVATGGGLAKLDGDKFVPANSPDAGGNPVLCVSLAQDHKIWSSPGGRTLIEGTGTSRAVHKLDTLPEYASVQSLLCATDGAIWAGSSRGLVRLKDGHEDLFTTANGLADDSVYCLLQGSDGTIWAGTKDGFSRFRGSADHGAEFESFHARDGLSQSTVYSLCEDREGSLWVGTKHGLNQFLDRRTTPFTESEGLASNDTGPVFQDRLGNIWIGTIGKGLCRFEGHGFSTITTQQGLASDMIAALCDDGNADLWVGTDKGLNRLHDGKVVDTFTTAQGLPSDSIRCLLHDHAGALWIGTSAGPAVLRDGRITVPNAAESLRTPVLAMVEYQGKLYLSSQGGGVRTYDHGQFTEFKDGSVVMHDVDAFYDDGQRLWMGTLGGGLHLLQQNKLTSFSVQDGLYDNDIYGIIYSDPDRFWFACSRGTFSVARDDLLNFAAGKIQTFISQPFSPTDAQQVVECKSGVQPAACRSSDGRLWFATIRGINVIDPAHLQRKLAPPPIVIDAPLVNGSPASAEELSSLPPGVSNLQFHYTGLSLVTPLRITFKYQLQGFDKDWIDAGNRREAFYTNLPPGNFKFNVMAANVDGTWTPQPTSIAFTIEPHIYQRSWFIPGIVFLIILVAWGGVRLRVRGVRQHMQLILAERSRIARELHDTLLQGFSGVTMEMQALSARLGAAPERERLQEIVRDAANSLSEARRSVAGLRTASTKPATLSSAIEQSARQLTETTEFRLKLSLQQVATARSPEVDYNLLRIASEAVTNSVKHSGGHTIEVSLVRDAQGLRLRVRDDGAGFSSGNGNVPHHGHYGLIGMKKRASQIGAALEVDSAPGRGTSVSVILPAKAIESAENAAKGDAI